MIARISAGQGSIAVPEFLRASLQGGATHIILREPGLSAHALCELTAAMVHDAGRGDLRIVVNDRLDVAVAAGAHGVHLRADGPAVRAVRAIAPPGFLIGRSAHSDEEIDRAAGADYLIYGNIFETPSKPGLPGQGLAALRRAVGRFAGPVLAIGGVTPANAPEVLATGAAGFAAIRMFRIQ